VSVEFRILGPVGALVDGEPVALGAPKQRALLAALLLAAGEVLSRERLIDELWGEQPPRSAVQSLQVYVHGLRQAIGAALVETHGTGYRLAAAPDQVDVRRFEQLVSAARQALPDGRPGHATEDLSAALRLWRGSPLADLAGEPIHDREAGRLDSLRLDAVELQNDAELALGRHEQLLGRLELLIAAEPYREHLRAQHVLALYRSGRQKDALEAHRAARAALVEELGVDPGPELRELETRILRHDPILAAPEPSAPGRLELPTPPTPLVGRRLEVAAVGALLQREDVRLVTLTGPGGTGKTRLGLAVAEEVGRQVREGAVFVDLAAVRDEALLAPTIAHALGVAEGASPEDALVDHLRDRSILLLLDNLEQLSGKTALIGRVLAAAARVLVLATSRSPLRLAGEHEYPVPPLEVPHAARATFEELAGNDAVRLFAARARAVDPEFELNDENIEAVRHVCERLDGLPLAIELAAARTKLLPPGALSRRLDQRLDLLTAGPGDRPARQQTLRATLEWSQELLTEAEKTLFARLAVFRGGWTLDGAQAVCGEAGADVLDAVAALVDDNLVRRIRRPDEPRFAMLETIAEYAAELLQTAGDAATVARRHAEYVLAQCEKAAPLLLVGDTATFARFDDEYENLRAALDHFADIGDVDSEVRVLQATWNYFTVRGHLRELRQLLEEAVAHSAGGSAETRAAARIHCGAIAFRQGDLARAREVTEEALALFQELGDKNEIGRCIGTLGNIAVGERDLDRAIDLYERAAALAREAGNKSRLAVILANLGSIAGQQDDAEASAAYAHQAAELQRELGERDGLAVSLHNLGRAQLSLGRLEDADESLGESLEIARQLGYREVIAYCLSGLAELALAKRESERAAELLGASESLFSELGAAVEGGEAATQQRMLAALHQTLGEKRADELRAVGAARPVDELLAA
jgi:predicted ATPase/DNA-binding SARP family transcriptional activator/Tfp pilus assembly protein PilF